MKFPVFLQNVVAGTNLFYINFDESPNLVPFAIPVGKYETLEELVDAINLSLGIVSTNEGLPSVELEAVGTYLGVKSTTAVDNFQISAISYDTMTAAALTTETIIYGTDNDITYSVSFIELPFNVDSKPLLISKSVTTPTGSTDTRLENIIYSQLSPLALFGYTDGFFEYDPGTQLSTERATEPDPAGFRMTIGRVIELKNYKIMRMIAAETSSISFASAIVDFNAGEWSEHGEARYEWKSENYGRYVGTVNFLCYSPVLPSSIQPYVDRILS